MTRELPCDPAIEAPRRCAVRYRRNHSSASRATSSRAPGSGNKCEAPGTTSSWRGHSSSSNACAVQLEDDLVVAAHDQPGGRGHRGSTSRARSGRPPRETIAPTDRGASRRRHERGPGPGAGPKIPQAQPCRLGLARQPVGSASQPAGQEGDVKDLGAVVGLVLFEEVDQKRSQAGFLQDLRDVLVARAQSAAAAAVREHDDRGRTLPAASGVPRTPVRRRDRHLALRDDPLSSSSLTSFRRHAQANSFLTESAG